jgi:hypothetical protein
MERMVMTEKQVKRAGDLIFARDQIKEYLTTRDPKSDAVTGMLESKYEFQQEDGRALPDAAVVSFAVSDARTCQTAESEEPQDLYGDWYIPRDVMDRALHRELAEIDCELAAIGVQTP